MAILLVALGFLVLYVAMLFGGTAVVVWSLNEIIEGADTPFWPVFCILVVLIAFVRGGSASKS